MTKVSEPFVKFDCAGCGREIDRQISARRARADIDELRDGPPLYCAECGPERKGRAGLQQRIHALPRSAAMVPVEEAAQAALNAQLPDHYRWGNDAMEQFNFGKKRAADAIRALTPAQEGPNA